MKVLDGCTSTAYNLTMVHLASAQNRLLAQTDFGTRHLKNNATNAYDDYRTP